MTTTTNNNPAGAGAQDDRLRLQRVLDVWGQQFPLKSFDWPRIFANPDQWCVIGDFAFVDLGILRGGQPGTLKIALTGNAECNLLFQDFKETIAHIFSFGKTDKHYMPDDNGEPVEINATIDYRSLLKRYIGYMREPDIHCKYLQAIFDIVKGGGGYPAERTKSGQLAAIHATAKQKCRALLLAKGLVR